MGFREYNPGLNRFLTRDMFSGALSDLSLGTDPWNANRYMFGGGNPISRIELNGHYAIDEAATDSHSMTRR
jgi:RHS repeat-associated protein